MVTSHKINESKMGYRGSKSLLETSKVKEQRVDGSYLSRNDKLRYTLMGFERNYQVGLHSNQINKKRFYTSQTILPETILLNPWFITGLSDAEGSFNL